MFLIGQNRYPHPLIFTPQNYLALNYSLPFAQLLVNSPTITFAKAPNRRVQFPNRVVGKRALAVYRV